MKALSFSQPWLWAVLHAGKHVENRSWPPPIHMIGERIALHAAKSFDTDLSYAGRSPIGYLLLHGFAPPASFHSYDKSAIVGVATIDRVVTEKKTLAEDQKRWFFGEYGWILTDVHALTRPIAATGKLGLWEVPFDMVAEINEQLGTAASAAGQEG